MSSRFCNLRCILHKLDRNSFIESGARRVPGERAKLHRWSSGRAACPGPDELLGRANQERHEQRLAFFFAEAAEVLKGVPGPLTRQLLQPDGRCSTCLHRAR